MKNFDEIRNKYRSEVINFIHPYRVAPPEQVINVMVDTLLTRDCEIMGGDFSKAVIENNLYEAILRADSDCLQYLKIIVIIANQLYFKK
jgi:hypothetical protein